MTNDVIKHGGYVIVGTGDAAASQNHKGYVVQGAGGGQVLSSRGTAILSSRGAVSAAHAQALLANPATVLSSTGYIAFANGTAAYVHNGKSYAVLQSFFPPFDDLELNYSFLDRRFPDCISFGSEGGPGFKTSVFTFDSGLATVEPEWERLRARYGATFENATEADVAEVEDFFYGMKGRAVGFRYKDWSDYVISNQNVGVGDGESRIFQIFKRYQSGGHIFDRIIKKTVPATSQITVDGISLLEGNDYFMLDNVGQIVFPTPPSTGSIIKIEYIEFDVPVRFDTDYLNISYSDFRQLDMSIPLIEVLV